MKWIPQLDALFSHVVSQWIYRWLPLPEFVPRQTQGLDLSVYTLGDFLHYYKNRWDPVLPLLPWMEAVLQKKLSPQALATLIYEQVQKVSARQAELLDYYHPAYPSLLRCIADPPNLLSALGNLDLLQKPATAIVGSRKASALALQQSHELASALASRGHVIVSGGAIGCDIAGHLGALQSGIEPVPTIVVFAGGLSHFYPKCNELVFKEVQAAGGLFFSERLWDFPARPIDFPIRNRIISGLASRLLVMQAGERSGARISALSALDQGRDVYVLVHPDEDVRALGSQQLLDDGAIPFNSVEDYLSVPLRLS